MNAVAHAASVSFEFRFAGAASADAASESGESGILSGDETRQQIFQLCQFNLNLAFARLRALSEDVEDELRAINHFEVCCFRKRAHLRGLQFTIKDNEVCAQL